MVKLAIKRERIPPLVRGKLWKIRVKLFYTKCTDDLRKKNVSRAKFIRLIYKDIQIRRNINLSARWLKKLFRFNKN